jgi:UPF0716 protein FxsA
MFIKLLLLFTLVPIIELSILIKIGTYIGVLPTILLVGVTGIIGVSLARKQGFEIIGRIKANLRKSVIPTDELIGGLLILIGGVMLLTPGLLTDITGFVLILPGSRDIFAKFLKSKFRNYIKKNNIGYQQFDFSRSYDSESEEDFVDIGEDSREDGE